MSSIRKRQEKYQVQVRVQGQKITKTFRQLNHARIWGVYHENKILLGNKLEAFNETLLMIAGVHLYLYSDFIPDQ